MFKWFSQLFKSDRGLRKIVEEINALEPKVRELTDEQLREESFRLKEKIQSKIAAPTHFDASKWVGRDDALDEALPQAFALIRETAKRTLGQRHFDVQLMGGIALHQGKIAEMRTGEGKTLAATAPVYLNALSGKGAHVVTVNEYLAKRDAVWMGQIYHALGLSVACLVHEGALLYDSDYRGQFKEVKPPNLGGSTSEHLYKESALLDKERDTTGGYLVQTDYLRPISRKEAYLADITYGTNHEFGFDYLRDNLAYRLEDQVQFRVNPRTGQRESAHSFAVIDEVDSILIDEARTPLIISAPDVESSQYYKTFARVVVNLKKDQDYLVDEKLHAIEITQDGIDKVEKTLGLKDFYGPENLRLAHYLVEALKAHALYRLDKDYVVKDGEIIIVDQFTGRLMLGRRYSGGLHQAIEAKEGLSVQNESRTFASISFQNYFRMYQKLAGMTGTAQTSAEEFDKVYGLDAATVATNRLMIRKDESDLIYKNLEAKYDAIIKDIKERTQKGQPILIGTVSIEKNEDLSRRLNRAGIRHEILNAKNHEREGAIIAQAGKAGAVTVATNMAGRGVDIVLGGNPPEIAEGQKIKDLGGLHIIGTERHESRRIDNQLRGRAGRQGDPGSSQFFLSLEDDLMRIFGGERIKGFMKALDVPEDMPIQSRMLNRAISQAQSKVEGFNFDARKHLLEYDDILNKQRGTIYKKRQELLETSVIAIRQPAEKQSYNSVDVGSPRPSLTRQRGTRDDESEIGLSPLAKAQVLQILDFFWMNHLENMEALGESVRLRAYGQHDPLVEYRREGHLLYQQTLADFDKWIGENAQKLNQNVNMGTSDVQNIGVNIRTSDVQKLNGGGKIGRNDPCPCGAVNPATNQSYKWKKCGMINAPHHKK